MSMFCLSFDQQPNFIQLIAVQYKSALIGTVMQSIEHSTLFKQCLQLGSENCCLTSSV
uniref:Uncharacterized protein n=1 Tax=Heterorhabditis bacteriophora TaxID=37862 RepID=A0A1I7WHJ6_HETBA